MNVNNISGFDAMTEEIRYVYAERDRLRDEVEALRQFKKDICEVLCIGGNSRNDGIVKLLKANKERTRMEDDDNRMYRDILDELKTYFKMTAPHWKYSDVPHFIKCSHEFALEKREDAEEQAKQLTEDICAALWVRPDMSTRDSILEEISKLRKEHDGFKYNLRKQEEFTEEATSILGVHPGDLSLSDILEALKKLKREEQLDDMNASIIADLKTERDKLQQDYLNEIGRRKTAERYLSDSLSKICSALGIEYSTDTTLEYILDTIDDLRSKEGTYCHQSFVFRSVCDYLCIASDDATLSDIRKEIEKLKDWKTGCRSSLYFKWFKGLCDSLEMDPDHTTWQDIFNEVEGLRAKYLNLCGDFACCCDKLGLDVMERNRNSVLEKIDDLRGKNGANSQSPSIFWIRSVCTYLGISPEDSTLEDIYDEIEKLKSWKTVAVDHDKRRREWVRKYKSEHERANSCDELYKKYKALYDADGPARKKLSDDIETYRASYEAVKNQATKNRSLMNTVANIVGTVGMHDDVTLTGVLNARKKANHWDILVDGYGEGTVRSLLENIGVDVNGDKGNGLFG